jgi:hypothetical protein
MNRILSYKCYAGLLILLLFLAVPSITSGSVMTSTSYKMPGVSMNGAGQAPALTDGGTGSFIAGTSAGQGGPVDMVSSTSYLHTAGFWYDQAISATDTDGDGIPDGVDDDDDNDGLLDIHESDTGIYVSATNTGSNPLIADTDGDTYGDGVEVALGSDPNLSLSVPDYEPGDVAPLGAPDGIVDVADALLTMRIATGQISPSAADLARADVAPLNGSDGKLDVADALLIMRKASGLASF